MFVRMLILLVTCTLLVNAKTACDRSHEKVGCFKRTPSILPDLIVNDRDRTHANYSGILIDWKDYGNYLHSLACRCEAKARGHYNFFAIGFYGECFAGRDMLRLERLVKTGLLASMDCVNGEYGGCDNESPYECSGKAHAEYLYTMNVANPTCIFKDGDGKGVQEIEIGNKNSKEECVRACWEYRQEVPGINGATMKRTGLGSCYCEVGMAGRYSGRMWQSCMFE